MFICSGCKQSVKGSKEHRVVAKTRNVPYKDKRGNDKTRKESVKEDRLCDICFEAHKKGDIDNGKIG